MTKIKYTGRSKLGCLTQLALSIGIIGAVVATWLWSHGADPQQAVAQGLTVGAYATGGACLLMVLMAVIAVAVAVWDQRSR